MINIKQNVPLAPYTIYRVGGPARFFTEVKGAEGLREALDFSLEKKAPFFILGAGSNILVSDKGFDGLIIRMVGGELKVDGRKLTVDAGVMMAKAVLASAKAGLTGFEWGVGVPGTLGGSERGNAGWFGGEMKDVVESAEIFDAKTGQIYILYAGDCEFGYRDSMFKRHPERVIISATLSLQEGDSQKIQEKIKKIIAERSSKQDIGIKSCGCIFKNIAWEKTEIEKERLLEGFPELREFKDRPNIPASFLIDRAGLKGKRAGNVFISPKHANFFVNEGGAMADEVWQLIQLAKEEVEKKYGLRLEEEIVYVGF